METVTNPHDKLFREVWGQREHALSFLTHYLPPDVLACLDLASLTIAKDSFIEKDLQDYFSDILYEVTLNPCSPGEHELQTGWVYVLFEHKSFPDRLIHLQLLEYMLRIWRLYLKQEKTCQKARYLPIVIPIVFTHGKAEWPYDPEFATMFAGSNDALARYIPDFEYLLHDVTRYSDAEIKGTVLARIVMLLFKHIFDPDIPQQLPRILALLRELLEREDGLHCVVMILRYIMSTVENVTTEQVKGMIEKAISPTIGENVMTIAEQLHKKGYEQGEQAGWRAGEQAGRQAGEQAGRQAGLLEGIELGLLLKFGDEGTTMMSSIRALNKFDHLEIVKNALKNVQNITELKAIVDALGSFN